MIVIVLIKLKREPERFIYKRFIYSITVICIIDNYEAFI